MSTGQAVPVILTMRRRLGMLATFVLRCATAMRQRTNCGTAHRVPSLLMMPFIGSWGTEDEEPKMNRRLLMSTAALLASVSFASAQGMQGGQPGGGAQKQESPGGSGAQSQSRGGEAGQSKGQRT